MKPIVMHKKPADKGITRRQLLARATAVGAGFIVGPGFLAASNAVWATELTTLQPETFATLVQMARDIYPHDQIVDEYYVIAVKGYDNEENGKAVTAGSDALNLAAANLGHPNYLDIAWERDRVDVLRSIENYPFFQQIRGGLVTGLYNQKEVWPLFGYEGESFTKGGYIDRGFNDINWL